jgi:hypothetical protein
MLEGATAIWKAVNQDSSVVAALVIAVIVLMYSHVHIWLASRARLKDKDRHIEDLIRERNRLQEVLFRQVGRQRTTSRPGSP